MSEVLDPDREIVDPHHHLWGGDDHGGASGGYLLADLRGDLESGHRVTQTVAVECGARYRTDGPEHLRSLGETEFLAREAAASESGDGATIVGIVAHVDLELPAGQLDEVLDAHGDASLGRLRGIRDALASTPPGVRLGIPGRAAAGRASNPAFRRGAARLGERGLTYDSWHFHPQNPEFLDLARATPGTTMVLDHFGTPLGVGPWEGKRDEVFEEWKRAVALIAECPNVVAKLGGMAMPDNGFGWHLGPSHRPDVARFVEAQGAWYHHTIECFGTERCMFESNFPVEKVSIDYDVYWNAAKTIAARYSESEKDALFSGTARRVYRL